MEGTILFWEFAMKGRFFLEHFGGDIIAIDLTHCRNDYDFQLKTIMVVDENGWVYFEAVCGDFYIEFSFP